MKTYVTLVMTTVLLVGAAGSSRAGLIILGNLPAANDHFGATVDAGAANGGINAMTIRQAVSFTMPAHSYPVERVALRLFQYNTASGDIASAGLYQDNGSDLPGAPVGGLFINPSSASNEIGQFTFLPSSPITLAASTKYWLMLGATSGSYQWHGSSPSQTPTSEVGAIFGTQIGFVGDSRIDVLNGVSSFEIISTVPEPAAACLTISALFVGLTLRHRQLKSPDTYSETASSAYRRGL